MSGDLWYKPKLIEVALPLEDINRESAREKSIYRRQPVDCTPVVGAAPAGRLQSRAVRAACR